MESNSAKQLLYTRKTASRLLGTKGIDVLKRLERLGKLTPVRLTGDRGQVFYRADELLGLVNREASDV